MDGLKTGVVSAGETGRDLLELDARSHRIGVAVIDAHQIGPIRLIQLAGDLDRNLLAGTSREPVDVAD